LHGHLAAIAEKIQPAAEKARAESTDPNDLIPRAIQANVWNTMERVLRESSIIRDKVESGTTHVIGAVYDLESGRVSWLGSHPAQDAIIALANQAQTDVALAGSAKSFAPAVPTPPGTTEPSTPASAHPKIGGNTATKVPKALAESPAHSQPQPAPPH
jgi:hypothetical protein